MRKFFVGRARIASAAVASLLLAVCSSNRCHFLANAADTFVCHHVHKLKVEIGDDIRSTRSTCSWRAEVNSGIVKGAEFLRDQILLYKTKPIINDYYQCKA
uniref:Secreted protein n=1 Tax=Glossina palpalis gambiensis TaxID=67801 RepID=A0A1B0BMG2_9MUSC